LAGRVEREAHSNLAKLSDQHMPTKRSGTQQPPEAGPSYAEWRAHVAALLVRQSLLPGVMRERDWQRLYKCGVTCRGPRLTPLPGRCAEPGPQGWAGRPGRSLEPATSMLGFWTIASAVNNRGQRMVQARPIGQSGAASAHGRLYGAKAGTGHPVHPQHYFVVPALIELAVPT
jgi:hypothetical protein